jgi:hypothetical protein
MINKYLIEPFRIDGLGGEKVKITPIEDISVSYILKIENRQQSIGDYIYQHILYLHYIVSSAEWIIPKCFSWKRRYVFS